MKKGTSEYKKIRGKQTENICQFVVKIMEMMKNYPQVVFWTNQGLSLKFKDLHKLQTEVIPQYFRHSNTLSFIRQLNMYYFSKVESDTKDQMVFEHKIFKEGNEANFHLIQRRNKFRDEILEGIKSNYSQTLKIIEEDPRLREQTKSMLRSAIQYHQIALKNLKKIKIYVDDLTEQLKTVRGKEVKKALQNLQISSMPTLNNLIEEAKTLETMIKNELCRDLLALPNTNVQSSPSQNFLLFGEQQTIKQMQGLDRALHLPSVNSLINIRSECSLGQNLKEQSQQQDPVSLEEQMKKETE